MEKFLWIEAREGKNISVAVHYPDNGSSSTNQDPVILYCHGFTGNKTGGNRMGVELGRKLCEKGYVVVRFDYVGSGESEGEFETDTHFTGWLKDLRTVLSWVKGLDQVDPSRIALIGHSLGGALVTHMASIEKTIKCVCALAPVTYLEENFRGIILGTELWERSRKGERIENFYNKCYSLSPSFVQDLVKYNIIASASRVNCPFLIVHGKQDQAVPPANSLDLLGNIKSGQKELKVLEGEGHIFREKIHSPIINWLNLYL
ncbi:MAG TPA: alpha/beta fold hydrolase [Bacillales bacterium]|nr:alpha/beta fold hydrolase [Bacillales bacterium]